MKIPVDQEEGADLVNLTPLIDVVFLLLIFFMVTAKFQEDERDLSVVVPEAENGDPIQDLPETMFVNVRKDGSYHVGSQRIDRDELKRDFGGDLVFHGGMDNQYTLAFGSVEDVRQEVLDNIRILGENGGYVLAPCHNIQAVSPPENIVALYETVYQYGAYE